MRSASRAVMRGLSRESRVSPGEIARVAKRPRPLSGEARTSAETVFAMVKKDYVSAATLDVAGCTSGVSCTYQTVCSIWFSAWGHIQNPPDASVAASNRFMLGVYA